MNDWIWLWIDSNINTGIGIDKIDKDAVDVSVDMAFNPRKTFLPGAGSVSGASHYYFRN